MLKKAFITFLKSILFFISWLVLFTLPMELGKDPAVPPAFFRLYLELLPFLSVLIATFLFTWFIEKRTTKVVVFERFIPNTLWGVGMGLPWIGLVIGMLLIAGSLQIGEKTSITYLPVWIFALFLNTIMQELLIRGYLFSMLKKNYNGITATAFTTILFIGLHGGAFDAGFIAVLNVVAMSVLMSIVLIYTGSLWAPIVMHLLWNGINGLLLNGISLADDYPHVFNIALKGSAILTGGDYKLEGSLITLAVTVVLMIAIKIGSLRKNDPKGI